MVTTFNKKHTASGIHVEMVYKAPSKTKSSKQSKKVEVDRLCKYIFIFIIQIIQEGTEVQKN